MSSEGERSLAEVFVVLADSLRPDGDVIDTMDALAEASTKFTSAVEAGIVLADDLGVLHVVASTSERAADVEEAQLGTSEGPCFDAFQTGTAVEIADITRTADKWPRFSALAAERGFRAAHAVPLRLRFQVLGSLNLFSEKAGPMSDRDAALAQALADVATIGIIQDQLIQEHVTLSEQLQHALTSRIIIEQAKGVLSQRNQVPIDRAFVLLRSYARREGVRIADVARQVVAQQLSI